MSKDWFAPKRYGYGAGLPIAWQGWAVLLGYVAAMTAAGPLLLPRRWLIWALFVLTCSAGLVAICAKRTRGGWRWRNGEAD